MRVMVSAVHAAEMFGVSERKFHELRHRTGFPAPVDLGPRCKRWRVAELEQYMAALPATCPAPAPEHLMRGRQDGDRAQKAASVGADPKSA
jgi:predicted DNA-binding transcriptional regulator AlpA